MFSVKQTKEFRRALDSGYDIDHAIEWVDVDNQAKVARDNVVKEWTKRGGMKVIAPLTNYITKVATGKTATEWKYELHIDESPRRYFLNTI